MIAVEGIPKAVLDHGIGEFHGSHFGPVAQMRGMCGQAHVLLTARNDDRCVPGLDGLVTERYGTQAGAADLIDRERRRFHGDAGAHRRLASGVLALARGEYVAQHDIRNVGCFDCGSVQRRADDGRPQLMGGNAGQRSPERSDSRACGRNDNNVCH